jgi:hypothetical protein
MVHDPAAGVWMKARVRYRAPDSRESAAGLSVVYASKYGAKTCAGSGAQGEELACAAEGAPPAAASASTATARSERDRDI